MKIKARMALASLLIMAVLTFSSCSAEMQSTSQASSNQTGTGLSTAVSVNDPIESTVQDATKLTLQTSATTQAAESTTGEVDTGSTWILTQYSDSTGSQAMFYTLSSNGGDN